MDCDTSLFDTAMSMLSYVATWQLTAGYQAARQRQSAHPTMTPFQAFPTADGWIVAGGAKEKFWRQLAGVLGRADLTTDPRFTDFGSRLTHRDELVAELNTAFRARTTADWVDALTSAGVPCAPVNTVAEALADPQVAARETVVETDHPRFGTVRAPASPVRVGDARRTHVRGPRHGEHSREVLADVCGYPPERIRALLDAGAVIDASVAAPR
jgi:crotonobetainyl-CoA:carnitine CoA-transferase CaiB-like acyl-CoA transferase